MPWRAAHFLLNFQLFWNCIAVNVHLAEMPLNSNYRVFNLVYYSNFCTWVWHKKLYNILSSFFLLFLLLVFWKWTGKRILPMFHHLLPRKNMTKIELTSLETLVYVFIRLMFIVKLHLCKHDMPYAIDINSNGRYKQVCEILLFNLQKHYISTNTMHMATKLGRMVTTMKSSHQ